MKTFRNPNDIHPPLAGCTHQVEVTGDERWLVMSSLGGMRADGIEPEDQILQMVEALKNIICKLNPAGMDVENLVKPTLFNCGLGGCSHWREAIAQNLG